MSFLTRTASKTLTLLPPWCSATLMLTFSPLLPLVSTRHRALSRLVKRLARQGHSIQFGPFAGMKYFDFAVGSQLLPKFAGTYELELVDIVSRVLHIEPDVVADLGSAEGYYAVGLARRLPGAHVIAYDVDPLARALCRKLAKRNGVADRVDVRGPCSPADLQDAIAGAARPLVICDVEGWEDDLLRPDETDALRRAHVLVELHDAQRAGVSGRVRARFEHSHQITVIPYATRHPLMLPADLNLTAEEAQLVMDEKRQFGQQWFWMSPRA